MFLYFVYVSLGDIVVYIPVFHPRSLGGIVVYILHFLFILLAILQLIFF